MPGNLKSLGAIPVSVRIRLQAPDIIDHFPKLNFVIKFSIQTQFCIDLEVTAAFDPLHSFFPKIIFISSLHRTITSHISNIWQQKTTIYHKRNTWLLECLNGSFCDSYRLCNFILNFKYIFMKFYIFYCIKNVILKIIF